jgi:hypothetical protein
MGDRKIFVALMFWLGREGEMAGRTCELSQQVHQVYKTSMLYLDEKTIRPMLFTQCNTIQQLPTKSMVTIPPLAWLTHSYSLTHS